MRFYLFDGTAPFESPSQSHFIGIFQIPSNGQPGGETAHFDPHRLDLADQIGGGRFSLKIGVSGDDQFLNLRVAQAHHQFADSKILGANPVYGRDRSTKNVILPAKLPGLLDGHDIFTLFNDTDERIIAPGITADPT
jgi:hypothetical protein